jgi:hypothetical protein
VRTVRATRSVAPLRPDGLVAEVVVAAFRRSLGLPVTELVLIELDPAIGRAESDPGIQDLLLASAGLNLGVDILA